MVYVDDGYINFDNERVSIMAADTDEELHKMAHDLHIPRAIFSVGRARVYYIFSAQHRDHAIYLGAKLVDRKFILANKLRSE